MNVYKKFSGVLFSYSSLHKLTVLERFGWRLQDLEGGDVWLKAPVVLVIPLAEGSRERDLLVTFS